MEESIEINVSVQQRFQELEEELTSRELELENSIAQIERNEEALEGMRGEVQRLTSVLNNAQAEKAKLEYDLHILREREDLWQRSGTSSGIIAELENVKSELDTVLKRKNVFAAENVQLCKQLESMKDQMKEKRKEAFQVESQLKESEATIASQKRKFDDLERYVNEIRHQLDQKMREWFAQEREHVKALQEAKLERDKLKIEMEKKIEDHKRTKEVLSDTTQAFGECMSFLKACQDKGGMEGRCRSRVATSPTINQYLMDFDVSQFVRNPKAEFEPEVDLDTLSTEDLKTKYQDLVNRFNKEVRDSVVDGANARNLVEERNAAMLEKTSINLELIETQKAVKEKAETIKDLQEKVASLRESIHDASAANFVQKHSLEALEKTNEEYAAKLKFLLKKIEAYEQQSSSTDDRTTKRVRPAFLPETMRDRNRPNSIHDIIETNRELKKENYQLKLDLEESRKAVTTPQASLFAADTEIMLELSNETETGQKRSLDEPPEPSRKRPKMKGDSESNEEHEGGWKEKWETARFELIRSKDEHARSELQLKQALEGARTQNELYVRDLKELEHQLVENGAKYDALMEVNKSQAEAFKAQMQSRTIRLKELDVVVVRMSQEIETLKDQLTEQKSAHAVIAHQLETEKRVSNGLKSEMIKIEGQHNEEIQKLKDKIEEQIAETMKQLSTPTETEGPSTVHRRSMSPEIAQDVFQQLKDKDRVIVELERRLQMTTEPLNKDMIYELQSNLHLAHSQIQFERDTIQVLQKELTERRQEYVSQLTSLKEEYDASIKEKDAIISKLDSERHAYELEIFRWKGQCEQYEQRESSVQQDLAAMEVAHAETIQDLRARLGKAQREIENWLRQNEAWKIEREELMAEIERSKQDVYSEKEETKTEEEMSDDEQEESLEPNQKTPFQGRLEEKSLEDTQTIPTTPHLEESQDSHSIETPDMEPVSKDTSDYPESNPEPPEKPTTLMSLPTEISSLLERAKFKVHNPFGSQSVLPSSQPSDAGVQTVQDEQDDSNFGRTLGGYGYESERQEGKRPKWKPIVYPNSLKKKEDPDDKKKDTKPGKH